ncbi:MAG TPA: winged helix-turn-helix domain-containing protein [Dokdonella sp.]|uniref:winged helix-turn-helix domain-containing protein n=1 Tax=Dokdonella sp. TaxID=2291710 RepID=UPI002C33487C|nr:winged helix-turn-helix domain-containing protein [Dokdonella sp.]HUD40500.1 winged helix-turn-helix domain-containing protein [Dokdonella sp.]
MSAARPALRFGAYRIDPAARELHRGGRLLVLSPRMFDCLAWLLEHRDRAVGRDELSAAVWGRADVTDTQIDQLIRKVRRVVGDSGSDQEVIRTIPRYGYRWVADVHPEPPGPAPFAEPAHMPAPAARSRVRRGLGPMAAATCIALAVGAAALPLWRGISTPTPMPAIVDAAQPSRPEAVAVLPIGLDVSIDGEWRWLRLGLMDLIGDRLRQAGLPVVPADNVLAMLREGQPDLDASAVQAATGARYVVAPALRRIAGGWRVHLELIDARGPTREAEAHADDAAIGARAAADRLLVMLGRAPETDETAAPKREDVLISRIDAAIYGRDYASARDLMLGAPPALQDAARLRLRLAEVERVEGHLEQAQALFQTVLDGHARRPLDVWTHADALHGLVVVASQTNRPQVAIERLGEMIDLARHHEVPLIYGRALTSRAALYTMQRQDREADDDFAQARIALEMAADTLGVARLEANQAAQMILRRRYVEAGTLLDRAIPRLERFAPSESLLTALGNRIHMHLVLLEPARALALAEHAQTQAARLDNPRARQILTRHVARALLANGRHAEAGRVLAALIGEIDADRAPDLYAGVRVAQAQLALATGQPALAAEHADQALSRLAAPQLAGPMPARTRAAAWLVRTRALRSQGDRTGSAAEQARFSAWASGAQDATIGVAAGLALAEQAAAAGRPEAFEDFETALLLAGQRATPADTVQVAAAYGEWLLEAGRLDDAARVIGQTAGWADRDFDCALLQARLYHALGQRGPWRQALMQAHALAGERAIPPALATTPPDAGSAPGWPGSAGATAQAHAARL